MIEIRKSAPHKYQQICNEILKKIETGELEPGARLPGVRVLGEQYGCNYHTVRHAFEILASQGYVELRRGSGTFVTERAEDYRRKRVSGEKVLRATDQIGVLLPLKRWGGHYVLSLIDQLHRSATEKGIRLNIRTVSDIDVYSAALSQELFDQGCCSILLPWISPEQGMSDLHDFVRASILPVVLARPVHGLEDCCFRDSGSNFNPIHSDTSLQFRYFQRLGYHNIALLGPVISGGHFGQKLMQYSYLVDHASLPSLIGLVDEEKKDYARIIERWLPMKGDLAIIAYHDELAMEFMQDCRRAGVSVPEDFAIIGHNNNPNGERSDPPLSSMLCPYDYIVGGMLDHALALSRGEMAQLNGREPRAFFIRDSCGGKQRMGEKGITDLLEGILSDFNELRN